MECQSCITYYIMCSHMYISVSTSSSDSSCASLPPQCRWTVKLGNPTELAIVGVLREMSEHIVFARRTNVWSSAHGSQFLRCGWTRHDRHWRRRNGRLGNAMIRDQGEPSKIPTGGHDSRIRDLRVVRRIVGVRSTSGRRHQFQAGRRRQPRDSWQTRYPVPNRITF